MTATEAAPARVAGKASARADRGGEIIGALVRLYRQFSPRRRMQLLVVIGLMLAGALAELFTLGAVLPFLAVISDPSRAAHLPVLGGLIAGLGWRGDSLVLSAAFLFATVALLAGGVRLLLLFVSQKFVLRLAHDLSVEVYRRTLYQPYSYHLARNSSALIADIDKASGVGFMLLALVQAVTALIITAFILGGLILIDPLVAAVAAIGFGGIYLAVSVVSRKRLRRNSRIIAAAQGERIKTVQEGVGGIRDVLLDQAQPVYVGKFSRTDSAFRDAQTANAFTSAAPRYVIEAVGMVLIAGLAVAMLHREGGLAVALPVLGALALGAVRMLPLLQQAYMGWTAFMGSFQMLLDVLEVLERPLPERSYLGRSAELPLPFAREITIERLGFAYQPGGKKVFEGLDLTIPRGARVGIVGRTGSGKSTLTDLVMGLLDPSEGRICVDGEPLSAANMARWQAHIAHVPQAIYLSDGTIAENIAFGVPADEIDVGRLQDAARQAAIAEFIDTLPRGYDTTVGERGVRLSGGQRQRIGIARALYRQADVLVFDEATSALDSETEAMVMEAVTALSSDLTVLMIAHRHSTLSGCDIILQLGFVDGPREYRTTTNNRAGP